MKVLINCGGNKDCSEITIRKRSYTINTKEFWFIRALVMGLGLKSYNFSNFNYLEKYFFLMEKKVKDKERHLLEIGW